VWAVVRTAIECGAVCTSRVEVQRIEHESDDGIEAGLRDVLSGADLGTLRARHVVLCGGPFTEELRARAGLSGKWLAPTRGTHVVLPRRRLPTDGAVVLPSRVDGRVMFVLPWPAHTIVGTTDVDAAVERRSEDGRGASSEKEIDYLLASANALVPAARLTRADVVSTWSGLRPLLAADAENPSARSREERIEHEGCVTTIAGGKLTAFRGMAEGVAVAVARRLVHTSGGRAIDGRSESATRELRLWGALAGPVPPPAWTHREPDAAGLRAAALVARYGRFERARREFDAGLGSDADGPELDAATRWSDVAWAAAQEDALLPADVLLRRTDLGYTRGPAAASLEGEIAERLARHRAR
jgi:glycerol-3-phosphate dehydrogenase